MPSLSREEAFLHALEKGYDHGSEGDWAVKENWKRVSKQYFKLIAEQLELDQSNVWFNPGGNAVSGDIHLQGRKGEKLFHLFGDLDIHFFVLRSIKDFSDYTGGPNTNIEDKDMDLFNLVYRIRRYFL
jgi:hypothetical protein